MSVVHGLARMGLAAMWMMAAPVWGAAPAAVPMAPPSGGVPATGKPAPPGGGKSTIDVTRVTVLGYHRFDAGRAHDSLSMAAADFENQMKTLRDRGLSVISMADFLAWLRGEKTIPERSVLITIDDGYTSVYEVAWPILKKFGYPFTLFVYINYISAGGKSLTWDRLREMAAGAVDIGCHSLSHINLAKRGGKSPEEYLALVRSEMVDSRKMLEERLGAQVRTFAYPYGIFNAEVERVGLEEAKYGALFTVYGQKVARNVVPSRVGRYVVLSDKPQIFESAIAFGGGSASGLSGMELNVQPRHGEVVGEDRPLLSVDLTPLGAIDPKTLEMTLTGFGVVPAVFDPATKVLSYQVHRTLRATRYTVGLKLMAGGKLVRTSWEFGVDERQRLGRFLPEQYPAVDPGG